MATGSLPTATGGTITPGLYVLTRVQFFGAFTSVPGEGLEFRAGGFFNRNHTTFLASSGAALTGFHQIGLFSTAGTSLSVETNNCNIAGAGREIWGYTATPTQLTLIKTQTPVSVETYLRQ
jgi:hypothetical protein